MRNMLERVLASLLLSVLTISILTMGSVAYAQHTERVIKANIPFDFTVGGRIFPAGRYALVRIQPSVLELRNSEGKFLANVLTQSVQASAKTVQPKLLFDSEGGRHVLTQVWQEDEFIGQQILSSNSLARTARRQSGHVRTAEVGSPR